MEEENLYEYEGVSYKEADLREAYPDTFDEYVNQGILTKADGESATQKESFYEYDGESYAESALREAYPDTFDEYVNQGVLKKVDSLGKPEAVQDAAPVTAEEEVVDTDLASENGLSELFVTPKEVGLDEEELSKLLNERFKGTQFEVDETFPFVDGIKITNKNNTRIDGKPDSETFFIDAFTDGGDVEYASKINDWIKGSKEAEESESNLVGGISMDQPVFEPETIARARLKYTEQAEKSLSVIKELQEGEDNYSNAVKNATLEEYNTVYNESVSKLNGMFPYASHI